MSNWVVRVLLCSSGLLSLSDAQTNVLTYRNDNMRTGQNLAESQLTPANVKFSSFGKLFSFPVDGKVDAQPLVAGNVVFAATEHDSVYAFDAITGRPYWQVSLLGTGETASDARGCGQVSPEIGITATPAIDLNAGPHGSIYVVAMSKDSRGGYHQRLHALDLTTGAEQFDGPVDVQATYPGTGDNSSGGNVVFDPKQYKERTGLLLVNGDLYTSWASHCDARPYTGWTITYSGATLAQTGVLNFTPNGSAGAIWGGGGGASADSSGIVYFQLGNGSFDNTLNSAGFPAKGDLGNAFVKVAPVTMNLQTVLVALDYWTMNNTTAESNTDQDLGSGGLLILPDQVDALGNVRHLGTGLGKDKNIYVFDRDNMGKFDAANNGTLYQEVASGLNGGMYSSPAWFNGNVYYGGAGDVIRSFKMASALLASKPGSTTTSSYAFPGTSPSISANGAQNGILWAIENVTPAVLHAYDANNLATELYNSNQASAGRDQFGAGNKFITPTVANGRVFVGTPNSVAVFGLIAAVGPVAVSVSPSSGSGASQTFIAVYSDSSGAGALSERLFILNATLSAVGACAVEIGSGGISLINDGNTGYGGVVSPGMPVSNSQCAVESGSVSSSGNTSTVTLSLTFRKAFSGLKNIYMYAADASGGNTGYVTRGAFTVSGWRHPAPHR